MIKHRSLRLRVAFGISMLAFAIVAVHSIAIFSVTDEQEEELIDQIVSEELEHFIQRYQKDPRIVPLLGGNMTAYVVHNDAERAALPPYLQGLSVGLHELFVNGGELHVGVRVTGTTGFYLAYDVTRHEERMERFAWLLGLSVGATALLSLLLGYWLSGLLIQPVSDLATRVDRLGPSQPSTALEQGYVDREIRQLARAFDRYVAKVAELVEREQEFTADVSHELRTPLTSVATGCELLLQEPALSEAARQRIESVRRAAQRISNIVQSMLFLARGAAGVSEPVALRECVEEAVEPLRALIVGKPVVIEIAVSADVLVRVDRTALWLVLTNLLRNATEHTDNGYVRVRALDGDIVVEDSGAGIASSDLPHVFQRGYRGSGAHGGGAGLGLAIVKRICDRYGWHIELVSGVSGTCVSVSFPTSSSQDLHNVLRQS